MDHYILTKYKPLSATAKERLVELVTIEPMSQKELQDQLEEEGLITKKSKGLPFEASLARPTP